MALTVIGPGLGRVIPALAFFCLLFVQAVPVQASTYSGPVYTCRDYGGNDQPSWGYGSSHAHCKAKGNEIWPSPTFYFVSETYYGNGDLPGISGNRNGWYMNWRHAGMGYYRDLKAWEQYSMPGNPPPGGCDYIDTANNNLCTMVNPAQICQDRAGTSKTMTGTGGWAGKPATFRDPETGCLLTDSGGVSILLSDGTWSGNYTYEGTLTETEPDGTETVKTQANGTTTCSTSAEGNTLCMDESRPNCMSFNGELVCGGTTEGTYQKLPSDGTCAVYDVGYICEAGATNTPVDGFGNPVASDGTAIGAESASGGVVDYTFYPNGNGDTSVTGGESGIGGTGGNGVTIDGPVEIDGSGVPGWSDGGAGASGNSNQAAVESSIGTDMGVGSTGITPQSAMPSSGACQSLTYTWNGHDLTFPTAAQCPKIESVKTLIGWFFYALTAFYLFHLATRKPG